MNETTQENQEMNSGQNSGAIVRQESFGSQSIATVQETASTAMAAMAKASVEARSIMAMRNPRNLDQVRSELLKECQRPSFAAVARYRKPIGQGIEGLSIRFVEQALQVMGNIETSANTVYDDDTKRIVHVQVMDYERNVCHSKQITVGKFVERNKLRNGQSAIGRRTGSNGQTVYIVAATDDDLSNKEAALVSKALRTCGLRLIPGWLQDESEQTIKATARDNAAKDPDSHKRKIADAFAKLNVEPKDLEEYLGHDLAKVSPAEIEELQAIFVTIRDGHTSWTDTIEHKREQRSGKPATASKAAKGAQAVKDKLAAKKAKPAKPLDAGQAAPQVHLDERKPPGAEAQGVAPGAKRPSRSKAAQEGREVEVADLRVVDEKAAGLYVSYGDPRNFVKGFLGEDGKAVKVEQDAEARMEQEAEAAAAETRKGNVATSEDGTQHDATTGEVLDSDEPEWMKAGPPPEEDF